MLPPGVSLGYQLSVTSDQWGAGLFCSRRECHPTSGNFVSWCLRGEKDLAGLGVPV